MIFGVRIKEFQKLVDKGEEAEVSMRYSRLLNIKARTKLKTKNIQELKFSEFMDCENYIKECKFDLFCAIFVDVKWWQTIYYHNLESVMTDYGNQKKELIEQNDFVFDPPQYGEPQKQTIGSELRKEFVERFGNYVVMMDVVCKGDFTKYKKVETWKVSEFFFWANYLTGQKIIEGVK